jgi:hypothetical protein
MTNLKCYYCKLDGKEQVAVATVHDVRGCLDVCIAHAKWRFTTSMGFGHSVDCQHGSAERTKRIDELERALAPVVKSLRRYVYSGVDTTVTLNNEEVEAIRAAAGFMPPIKG